MLSMNGRDVLDQVLHGNSLAEAEVCQGDLVYLMNPGVTSEVHPTAQPQPQPQPQSQPQPAIRMSTPAFPLSSSSSITQTSAPAPPAMPAISVPVTQTSAPAPPAMPAISVPVTQKSVAAAPQSVSSGFQEKLGAVLESTKPKIPHEAVCGLVHLLMLDAGFQPTAVSPGPSSTQFTLPPDWRRNSQFVFQYTHPRITGSGEAVTVKCVTMQGLLLVHATLKASPAVLSLKIPVTDFVRIDRPLDSGPGIFQKLDQFVRLFKDSISFRLVTQVYEAAGTYNRASLSGLASDVKLLIFSFLGAPELTRLAQVCREFRVLTNDPFLWRHLAVSRYHLPMGPISTQDWKQAFVRRHKEEQERKRQRVEREWDPYPGIPHPHGLINPPPFYPAPDANFPGIYGGDYDRFPGGLSPFNPGPGFGQGPGFGPRPGGIGPFLPAGVPPGARFDPFGPTPDINPFGSRGRGRGGGGGNPFGGGFL